jgi:hypothetical protein
VEHLRAAAVYSEANSGDAARLNWGAVRHLRLRHQGEAQHTKRCVSAHALCVLAATGRAAEVDRTDCWRHLAHLLLGCCSISGAADEAAMLLLGRGMTRLLHLSVMSFRFTGVCGVAAISALSRAR